MQDTGYVPTIRDNLLGVRERIAAAAARAGRSDEEITLVCVSKTVPASIVRLAMEAGATDLGENYVQEAQDKIQQLGREAVRWHLIGHLQSNKAGKAAGLFDMIQSVDSVKLASRLDQSAAQIRTEADGRLDVLLEVNVAGEATKTGTPKDAALDVAAEVAEMPHLRLRGIMGIPPPSGSDGQARSYFAELRRIWQELPEEHRAILSMGMSADFEAAIEEGSTMVRVGSAVFGARPR